MVHLAGFSAREVIVKTGSKTLEVFTQHRKMLQRTLVLTDSGS